MSKMAPKSIAVFGAAYLCILASLGVNTQKVEEKFYEQKLIHSDSGSGTWKQRYLENRQYFKPGGPVFLALGGPFYGPVAPAVLQQGSMVHYAKKQGAAIVLLETRYYGKSRPTSDLSSDNLHKYLTIKDDVADSAAFIRWYKTLSEFKDSKFVAFGHVYLGSRIIQNMRTEPGLIDIGVVSSAPVESRFELPEYTKREIQILRDVNAECADTVHEALLCFDKIVHNETCEGHKLADMKETFDLCGEVDPSKPLDSASLVGEILKIVGYVVLLDDPTAPYNVHKMCEAMGDTSKGHKHVDKLALEIKKIRSMSKDKKKCLEFRFEELEKKLESISWDEQEKVGDERQRFFSRCKYSMTLRTPEGIDLGQDRINNFKNYSLEMCRRAFNLSPDQVKMGTEVTNKQYGMRMIPSKCAIFISEGEDLLQDLEITTQDEAGKCNAVVYSKDGGILSDNLEVEEDDEIEYGKGLKESHLKIGDLIDRWLKTGDCCTPSAKRIQWNSRHVFEIL